MQAEDSETFVWFGSERNMECSGCRALRKEVEELRNNVTTAAHQRDEDARCNSTYISERKQMQIDKLLMGEHRKAETFQEAYEKVTYVTV